MATEQEQASHPSLSDCYVVKATGRQWQITSEVMRQLLVTNSWTAAPSTQADPPYHLLLSDRGRVQWSQLIGRKAPATRFGGGSKQVLVNALRGNSELTNKSALCKTMRRFALEHGLTAAQIEYLPDTFVLRPGGEGNDERAAFLAEFHREQQVDEAHGVAIKNAWIAKANRGAKGSAIFVSDDPDALLAYIDAQNQFPLLDDLAATSPNSHLSDGSTTAADSPCAVAAAAAVSSSSTVTAPTRPASSLAARAPPLRSRLGMHSRTTSLAVAASNSWVLQRYIGRPFLLHRRKFDIRCWVLCDSEYNIHLYRNGVCRVCTTEFTMDDLADTFVHLSNHCIQEGHPEFSSVVEGNELFFPELQSYLDALPASPLHPRLCVVCHLLPQLRRVVLDTLESVRSSMSGTGEYRAYQLFGYDFMLDEHFHVRLLEINATPASAEKLLTSLVRHMIDRTIHLAFPRAQQYTTNTTSTASSSPQWSANRESAASILARPCSCSSVLQGATKQQFLGDDSNNLFDLISK